MGLGCMQAHKRTIRRGVPGRALAWRGTRGAPALRQRWRSSTARLRASCPRRRKRVRFLPHKRPHVATRAVSRAAPRTRAASLRALAPVLQPGCTQRHARRSGLGAAFRGQSQRRRWLGHAFTPPGAVCCVALPHLTRAPGALLAAAGRSGAQLASPRAPRHKQAGQLSAIACPSPMAADSLAASPGDSGPATPVPEAATPTPSLTRSRPSFGGGVRLAPRHVYRRWRRCSPVF